MNIALNVIAMILIVMGGIWFFQGINILLGSFMSGEPRWAIIGAVVAVVGVVLLLWNNRHRVRTP